MEFNYLGVLFVHWVLSNDATRPRRLERHYYTPLEETPGELVILIIGELLITFFKQEWFRLGGGQMAQAKRGPGRTSLGTTALEAKENVGMFNVSNPCPWEVWWTFFNKLCIMDYDLDEESFRVRHTCFKSDAKSPVPPLLPSGWISMYLPSLMRGPATFAALSRSFIFPSMSEKRCDIMHNQRPLLSLANPLDLDSCSFTLGLQTPSQGSVCSTQTTSFLPCRFLWIPSDPLPPYSLPFFPHRCSRFIHRSLPYFLQISSLHLDSYRPLATQPSSPFCRPGTHRNE